MKHATKIIITLLFTANSLNAFATNKREHTVSKPTTRLGIEIPGEHALTMRTRFHDVSDNNLGNAQAFTTRVSVQSKFTLDDSNRVTLNLEPNYVHAFNENDYSTITVIRDNKGLILDPPGSSLPEANIQYKSTADWQLTAGRQRIRYDDERLVGSIDYWQTPQHFDAISIKYDNSINLNVQYAYATKVHRILGKDAKKQFEKDDIRYNLGFERPSAQLGRHSINAHLLNAHYQTQHNTHITAYQYTLDNQDVSALSSHTTGVRISDQLKPQQLTYRYTVEYAYQQDGFDNPNNYQTWFSFLDASIQYKGHRLSLSQDILSQDSRDKSNPQVFNTSLGTNEFLGWADAFYSHSGIRDKYLTYRVRYNKWRFKTIYHRFDSYNGNTYIGDEIDFELKYHINRDWQAKLVLAHYRPGDGDSDIDRANNQLTTWYSSISYNF